MKSVAVEGQLRTEMGKKHARNLRADGKVLGVIYGGEKEVHFSATQLALRDVVYTHEFNLAEVTVEGKSYKCILKDVQFDVVTDKLLHIDFLELVEGKKVVAELPVSFKGSSEGVKAGGRLEAKLKTLKVRTYPRFLVETIVLDITKLQINDNLRVEDVKNENFEFMNPLRQPIATIAMTRALRQAETAEAKGK